MKPILNIISINEMTFLVFLKDIANYIDVKYMSNFRYCNIADLEILKIR
jgi:hypothetical protein